MMFSFLYVIGVGGVFALWHYTENNTIDETKEISLGIVEFIYRPEEVLPGDEEADNIDQNHLLLV